MTIRAAASDVDLRETDGRAQLVAYRTSSFADAAGSVSKDTVWFRTARKPAANSAATTAAKNTIEALRGGPVVDGLQQSEADGRNDVPEGLASSR
ncbi:hypothetical protein C1878_13985 [Gordonibacter sp. 28C]|uniref:hypothetical protein n=1 Tax=Gordonibacter sp. 28C TaxID=2078569 RepID=UPI000DF7C825|nr:hypothetical protein [Gordonibacter sp. 28C]RDB60554.1 hypothetical protein C1878_13985 [Gordonibacter sp. 28C]